MHTKPLVVGSSPTEDLSPCSSVGRAAYPARAEPEFTLMVRWFSGNIHGCLP